MPQNFIECDREQDLLLPPSLREWLPDDHLAWYVIDAVAEMDLEPFYSAYRSDGWGRAAFGPQMMVALLLYAYALGERSARKIERRCSEDVAFRVICATPTTRRSRASAPVTSRRSRTRSRRCSRSAGGRGCCRLGSSRSTAR
jgi:transposase